MTIPVTATPAFERLIRLTCSARYRRRVRRVVRTGRPVSVSIRQFAATSSEWSTEISLESAASAAEATNMDWLDPEAAKRA